MQQNRDKLKKQVEENENKIEIFEKINRELSEMKEIISKSSKGTETNKVLDETDFIINEGKKRIEQISKDNKNIKNEIKNMDEKQEFKDKKNKETYKEEFLQ